jgi:hypothetical protein
LPAPSETAGALPTIAAEPEQTQTPAAAPLTPPFGLDWATLAAIGGCAALLAALVAVFAWWRNRARVVTEARFAEASLSQPSPPARLDKTRPAATPARTKAPEKQVAGELSVQFVPTNAQLSIASLTVTGKLTVANLTGANVGELALRSQMMSAQDGQREAIAAFHENRTDGEIQPLGDMVPGERIDAIIEIRLPRTELHAFRWTEREFVAPIVMVNVAGTAGGTPVEARLSQLIGRESTGTSRRMKPLAIDRGPKRYQGIEARPVFA